MGSPNTTFKISKRLVIFCLVLLIGFVTYTNAIVISRRFKFRGRNKFKFITKFAIGEGRYGHFSARARLVKPYSDSGIPYYPIKISYYDSMRWDLVTNTDDCVQKTGFKDSDALINVPSSGEWSQANSNWGTGKYQTKLWFAAVSDCQGELHARNPSIPKIEIEVTMMNDTSHFSQEDMGILPFYCIMFVLFLFFLGKTIKEFYADFKSDETLENPLLPLMISLNADILSIGFLALHFLLMAYDGSGIFVLSVFARLLRTISQATMLWLLITIAYGWSVTYRNMVETDVYILSAIFIGMIHLLIAALTYVDDAEHHKFHDFGGLQGIVLIVIRLVIYGVFLYGIQDTKTTADRKQKEFLNNLRLSASLYILSFPVLWIISFLVEPYVINRVITFGTVMTQVFATYWILHQFTQKGTSYYKASHKSKTILPGAKYD